MKKQVAVFGAGALIFGFGASAAFANANHKSPSYQSNASSSAGLVIDQPGAPVVSLFGVRSTSSTKDSSPSTGSADADGITVAGQPVAGGSHCQATATPTGGQVSQSDANSLVTTPAGQPLVVTVLPTSCTARAVQNNNAQGSADSALVTVTATGAPVSSVSLLPSHSDNTTTSGQANSNSSFDVATITANGATTTIPGCSATSSASNGGTTSTVNPANCPVVAASSSWTNQ